MTVVVTTRVRRPIDAVWRLLADDFTSVRSWSASVVTSEPLTDVDGATESPMAGRYCTFTDDPEGFGAREVITKYDRAGFHLEFDVHPVNAPAALPIRSNHITVTLHAMGPTETEVRWVAAPVLKPHAYLLYPIVKWGLAKSFRDILGELKAYAEGEASSTADAPRPHLAASR